MKLQSGPILAKLTDGVILLDLNHHVLVINPSAAVILKLSPSEVLGHCLTEVLEHLPDLCETIQTVLAGSAWDEHETIFISPDDKKVYKFRMSAIKEGESYTGCMLQFTDITHQRQAEESLAKINANLANILDALTDYYFETDLTGVITNINQAFCNHLGYSYKEDVLGKHFRHFTDRASARRVFLNFSQLFKTKESVELFKYSYHTRDGNLHIGETTFSPIFEGDVVVGARGVVRDITDRERAEDALRQAKAEVEARAEELATLNRITTLSSQSLNLEDILRFLCMELTYIFPIRNAGIALITPDKSSLEVVAFHSRDPEEETALGVILPLKGNPASQEVIRQKKTIVIADAQSDSRMEAIADLSRKRGTKSIMIVPLLTRGNVIGTIGMPARDPDYIFDERQISLAETIASQISTAIDNAQLYASTKTARDAAEHDLQIGHEIQAGFLPERLPRIPGWEIAAHFEGARQVAGDFYDFFPLPNSNLLALVIADVCDKGVGAALFMVMFRTQLRAFSQADVDGGDVQARLKAIIQNTNDYISRVHENSNMFATVFFGILDPESGTLYYVNAGHEPPIILNKEGRIACRLKPTGPVVGLFPQMEFRVERIELELGDFLVSFTDGVMDARDRQDSSFTEERLLKYIQSPWSSLFSMIFELKHELKNHMGGEKQFDDITLISIRRKLTSDRESHAICRVADKTVMDELRDFVEQAALEYELDHDSTFAFRLAMEEACENIIQHGLAGRDDGLLSLTFERDSNKARLIIRDDGRYFHPDQADIPDLDAGWKDRKLGGLGIYLIKQLMDHVSYSRMGEEANELILEKEFHPVLTKGTNQWIFRQTK